MSQSRLGSAVEAVVNVLVGYGIAVASQVAIFPLFGIHIPLTDNLLIGVFFTLISLVRSYVLRRAFEGISPGEGHMRMVSPDDYSRPDVVGVMLILVALSIYWGTVGYFIGKYF